MTQPPRTLRTDSSADEFYTGSNLNHISEEKQHAEIGFPAIDGRAIVPLWLFGMRPIERLGAPLSALAPKGKSEASDSEDRRHTF